MIGAHVPHPDLPAEQDHLDEVYAHLDAARRRDQESLRKVMLDDDPEPQARVEREVEYHRLQTNLERYRHAEVGLVFGRIDIADDEPDNPVPGAPGLDRRYIGRMGLSDADDDYRSLLMDWRAPQARPFYLATTAHPEGVTLRRHLRTRGRTVRAIDDERLTGDDATAGAGADGAGAGAEASIEDGVGGEAVLREVIDSARTGHMRGIVETIQREQDLIIRDAGRGAMVVQGGPGTGKTAVALHRVAWLLYTHRDQLAKTGVLILGPNTTFLEYISRVLPSLGETGVVLRTIADLYPGVSGTGEESLATREVKGSEEMTHILRQAVRDRQPDLAEAETVTFDGVELAITPAMVRAARTRARRSRKPHNLARPLFREHLVESLARLLADRIGADPLGGENLLSTTDVADLRDELDDDAVISGVLDDMWPELTPEELLTDLLESEDRIASAAAEYDDATRAALLRPAGTPMGPSDPPLLDELAELLGATLARLDAGRPQELVDAVDVRDVAVQARHLVQGAPLSVREPLRGVHVLVEGDEVGLVDVAEHAPGELVGDVAGGQQRGQRADRPADDPPVGDVQPGEDLGEELDHLGLRALAAAAHELDAELGELARLPLERGLLAHHGSGVPEAAGQLVARDPRCHQARDGQREVGAQHQQAAV